VGTVDAGGLIVVGGGGMVAVTFVTAGADGFDEFVGGCCVVEG